MDAENESVADNPAESDTTDPKSPAQATQLSPPAEPQSTDPISDDDPIQEEDKAGQGSPDDNDEVMVEDSTESTNETALHKATRSGHLEVVKSLLEQPEINVDAVTSDSETVLHLAAEGEQLEMVQLFLTTRIDVDATNNHGRAALHIAAEGGSLTIVQELLKKHANINIVDEIQESALHKAAEQGHAAIVRELLQSARDQGETAQADQGETAQDSDSIAGQGDQGETAQDSDSTAGQGDGPKEPVQLFDINAKSIYGDTAFTLAAWKGHSEVVKLLLENKANVDEADNHDITALTMAALEGHVGVVEILLDHHAKTEPRDNLGSTALDYAVRYKHIEIVEKLLDANAAFEDRGEDGTTLLHWAAEQGYANIVKVLLEKKAEIDAQNDDGWTPVFLAVKEGNYDALRCLLEWDPRPSLNISTSDERSPLYQAAEMLMTENKGNGTNKETEENNNTAPDDRGSTKSKDQTLIPPTGQDNKSSPCKQITDLLLSKIDEDDERRIELIRAASRKQDSRTWRFLFDMMTWKRFNSEDLEKEANFVWHAANGKHDELKKLLREEATLKEKQLRDKAKLKELPRGAKLPSEDKSRDGYTVLQWAAYLGMYVIVWKLIRNGCHSDTQRNAALVAAWEGRNLLAEPTRETPKGKGNPEKNDGKPDSNPIRKPGDRKKDKYPISKGAERTTERTTERNTEPTDKDPQSQIDYSITVDILKDPPFIEEANEPVPNIKHPSRPKAVDQEKLREFFATLVDFYMQDERVEFLRQSPTVDDIIYNEDLGPAKIMKKAIDVLTRIDPGYGQHINRKTRKVEFRWIHLPANCTTWMKDLTYKILWENEKGGDERKPQASGTIKFLEKSLHDLLETSSQAPYIRPSCSREKILPPDPDDETHNERSQPTTQKPAQQDLGSSNKAQKKDKWRVALYMPYVILGWKYPKTQSDNPPEWLQKDNNWLKKDNWLKKTYASEVYQSRTLDQFYYYAAKDTEMRDCDQIVTKFIDKQLQRKRDQRGEKFEILRVDQLWLWVIDEATIISSSTHRSDAEGDVLVEEVLKHIRETQKSETANRQKPPTNVDEMIKLIAWHSIRSINHPTWKKNLEDNTQSAGSPAESAVSVEGTASSRVTTALNSKYSPRQMFAHQLNEMTESESRLLRSFVDKVERKANNLKKQEEQKEKNQDSNAGNSPTIDKTNSKGKQDQRDKHAEKGSDNNNSNKDGTSEHLKAYESIHAASKLLREVKDIRDELGILRFLLQQQRMVWNGLPPSHEQMTSETTEATTQRRMDREKRQDPYESRDIKEYIDEIDEMEKMAKRIQDSIDSILGLEQNEASLIEAEEAQRLTIETMQQGKTLMVFTIVTILFLPLSFLTSLFALNVNVFPHNGDNLLYKGSWIFPIIFLPAVGIILLLVIPTFYLSRIKSSIGVIKSLMRKSNKAGNDQNSARHLPDRKQTPTNSAGTRNEDISGKKKKEKRGFFESPQNPSHSQPWTTVEAGPAHEDTGQQGGPPKTETVIGEKGLNEEEIRDRHSCRFIERVKMVFRGRKSTNDTRQPTIGGV